MYGDVRTQWNALASVQLLLPWTVALLWADDKSFTDVSI